MNKLREEITKTAAEARGLLIVLTNIRDILIEINSIKEEEETYE